MIKFLTIPENIRTPGTCVEFDATTVLPPLWRSADIADLALPSGATLRAVVEGAAVDLITWTVFWQRPHNSSLVVVAFKREFLVDTARTVAIEFMKTLRDLSARDGLASEKMNQLLGWSDQEWDIARLWAMLSDHAAPPPLQSLDLEKFIAVPDLETIDLFRSLQRKWKMFHTPQAPKLEDVFWGGVLPT